MLFGSAQGLNIVKRPGVIIAPARCPSNCFQECVTSSSSSPDAARRASRKSSSISSNNSTPIKWGLKISEGRGWPSIDFTCLRSFGMVGNSSGGSHEELPPVGSLVVYSSRWILEPELSISRLTNTGGLFHGELITTSCVMVYVVSRKSSFRKVHACVFRY